MHKVLVKFIYVNSYLTYLFSPVIKLLLDTQNVYGENLASED